MHELGRLDVGCLLTLCAECWDFEVGGAITQHWYKTIHQYMQTLIFCPCREKTITLDSEDDVDRTPSTLHSPYSLHSLESLLYCPSCLALKCTLCTDQEIVSRFCVQCFAEATETSARASSNTCVRNCLQCPECGCNAKVSPHPQIKNSYSVSCHYCDWKFGKELNKNGSLSHQVRALIRQTDTQLSRSQTFVTGYIQKNNPRIRRGSSNVLQDPPIKFDLSIKDKRVEPKDEFGTGDMNDNEEHLAFPALCPLRSKTEKRCHECAATLTKPEPKPDSRDFKVKNLAMNLFPALQLEAFIPTESSKTLSEQALKEYYLLTVTNPSTMPIRVSLAAPKSAGITISVPDFELGGASGKWNEKSLAESVPHSKIVRQSKVSRRVFMDRPQHPPHGFHDAGRNWAIVQFEVRVEELDSEVADIPLFVTFTGPQGQNQEFWCLFKPNDRNNNIV